MEGKKPEIRQLLTTETFEGVDTEDALKILGSGIDASFDSKELSGLEHAIKLGIELETRDLTPPLEAELFYFLGNAWGNIRNLKRQDEEGVWDWATEELQNEFIYFRKALSEPGFSTLAASRQCEILTNLANCFDFVGRFSEAIEYWDRALEINPEFGMAIGNKGYGISFYALALYDEGQRAVFLKYAYDFLKKAVSYREGVLHPHAKDGFEERKKALEEAVKENVFKLVVEPDNYPLGETEAEKSYRLWCLKNRLFINPLNDILPFSISARDVLTTPSIILQLGEGPHYQGFFNQMKQEFVSARYFFFEGINTEGPHFSDKGVLLYNTMDYPVYSLSIEKVKAAFRMVYSIFDKFAYFLNVYLELGIPERKIKFRTFWYNSQKRKRGLKSVFLRRENWPLRGLFWLSKDLYEDEPGFKEAIEPEAQEIADIRNRLEHKYLKIHDDLLYDPDSYFAKSYSFTKDKLAISLRRREFENKTLKLLKLVRAGFIYLSLGIELEERRKRTELKPNDIVPPMFIDTWDDDWKR